METTLLASLSLEQAVERELAIAGFVQVATVDHPCPPKSGTVAESQARYFPTLVDPSLGDELLLLVHLPAYVADDLEAIATSPMFCFNCISADLRESRPMMSLSGKTYEVGFDLYRLTRFPGGMHRYSLFFLLVAGERVVLSRHSGSADERYELECDLSAMCMTGGGNYNPWAIYSEEEMKEAEGRQHDGDDKFVVIEAYLTADMEDDSAA